MPYLTSLCLQKKWEWITCEFYDRVCDCEIEKNLSEHERVYLSIVFVIVRLNYPFQKMSEWVAVCADEAEEPVEIPTEADGDPFGLIEHVKS